MLTFSAKKSAAIPADAYRFALAGLARLAASCATLDESIQQRLHSYSELAQERKTLLSSFHEYLKHPSETDSSLLAVAAHFQLTTIETLAVRLAMAAEEDLWIGHVLTHLQQPLAHSRPTLGLLARAFAENEGSAAIYALGCGAGVRCGLLLLSNDDLPLPERQVRVSLVNSLALRGFESQWPGTSVIPAGQIPLGATAERRAAEISERISNATSSAYAVIIRSGDVLEARAAAERICAHGGMGAVLVPTEQPVGIAPWLFLNDILPVFQQRLAPGERKALPSIPGFQGSLFVLTGAEGDFESEERTLLEWRLQTPPTLERKQLWSLALRDDCLAHRMATEHRHGAGRIASLADKAREHAGAGQAVTYDHIRAVSRRGDAIGLGAMAELITDEVDDAALVAASPLREELESLVVRCRRREQFCGSLGPSMQARYRPSVRALFVGPSGTGKTLAAAWLASRLGIPLYRVDLSAVTSKYIGETEKNLSQLLTQAEQNEVVLLFDEADALFGKRTDIQEANDRFANQQTNYLLQRMESYDGITVLTSNGRTRFDAAFSRRFDAIVSFPLPGPEERRALWSAHLGDKHRVSPAQLNLLSVAADFSGGQIRNAVLCGAVAAAERDETIVYRHLLAGVAAEYRKLNRQLPSELKQAEALATA